MAPVCGDRQFPEAVFPRFTERLIMGRFVKFSSIRRNLPLPIGRGWRPQVELLEARLVCAIVHFDIQPDLEQEPISPFIYGRNSGLSGAFANLNLTRLGGNRWTAYNWENNASNAGSDYFFQNDGFLGGGDVPGGAVQGALDQAAALDAAAVITIPINGYVAADKLGGGDVRNSGPNYLQTRFKEERARKGAPFTLTPSVTDAYVYQDEFVNWVNTNYPHGQTDPTRPIFYSLDNEPDLWAFTHEAIHPNRVTYAELAEKTLDYAAAIKDVVPGSKVFGPVNYGWHGFTTLQDAPDRNGRDFHTFYLQQLAQAQATSGRRLVDALDVHWYPEAQGGGVRITEDNNSAAVVAARLQAPRSLWDPTFTETSWITQWSTGGPIRLIPRMQAKIDQYYPDTRLAFTEYNYGGGNHISGGIAQADVLGIFGREGIFAAAQWPLLSNETFVGGAFRMFRDFDGQQGTFGDTSVSAITDDVVSSSIYASIDTQDPNALILVAINKTDQPLTAVMDIQGLSPSASSKIYRLAGSNANPVYQGELPIGGGGGFTYVLPAFSVHTFRINGRQTTPLGDFNGDGVYDCEDVDPLVAAIASGSHPSAFDITGDTVVTIHDLNRWREVAGAANLLSGGAYPVGDANLDGFVDGTDFNLWNAHKFTATAAWCAGDFSADGRVDGSDFNLWNANKFTAALRLVPLTSPAMGRQERIADTVFAAWGEGRSSSLPPADSNYRASFAMIFGRLRTSVANGASNGTHFVWRNDGDRHKRGRPQILPGLPSLEWHR